MSASVRCLNSHLHAMLIMKNVFVSNVYENYSDVTLTVPSLILMVQYLLQQAGIQLDLMLDALDCNATT